MSSSGTHCDRHFSLNLNSSRIRPWLARGSLSSFNSLPVRTRERRVTIALLIIIRAQARCLVARDSRSVPSTRAFTRVRTGRKGRWYVVDIESRYYLHVEHDIQLSRYRAPRLIRDNCQQPTADSRCPALALYYDGHVRKYRTTSHPRLLDPPPGGFYFFEERSWRINKDRRRELMNYYFKIIIRILHRSFHTWSHVR